jgi:hypothetical protein
VRRHSKCKRVFGREPPAPAHTLLRQRRVRQQRRNADVC